MTPRGPALIGPALLFCPADRGERYAKALAAADSVIIDLEDALHPAAQGTDSANSAQPPAALDDSLFPVETQSPETLAHAAEAAAHDAMAASPDQPTQAQAESTSPQPQSAEAQAAPAAASPSPDIMESETDQMAVLQHLTQNGH